MEYNLLRCDYRLLKAEEPDITDMLIDFLHPLPDNIQTFALKLYEHYTGEGMTCTLSILDDVSFSYANLSKSNAALSLRDKYQKRVWAFSYSLRNSYSLFVRAKRTDKYAEVIKEFSLSLQEKIAEGYAAVLLYFLIGVLN